MTDIPVNEISNLNAFQPMTEQRNLSVGDLEMESDEGVLALRGSLDIIIDENSLARAKALRNVLDRCINLIEKELEKPESERLSQQERKRGNDPFGHAFD